MSDQDRLAARPEVTVSHQTADNLTPGDQTQDLFASPAADFTLAAQVPGYRILSILGRGGMGVVYKALQEKANRLVALKMILSGAHADPADKVRFRAEAEAAARLSHPQIVQLYDVGETPDGFPYCSLEYVGGGTLAMQLKQGPLNPHDAAILIEALARAMQYAHERGIVHRDLKPGNILLQGAEEKKPSDSRSTMRPERERTLANADTSSPTGVNSIAGIGAKIADFGLAKQLDTEDALTRTGAIMGTPNYMAPEQAFGQSKHVGPAADIYSLGAILYECLAGRPPFKGATVADTLEQVRTTEPIALRTYARNIPADLETICLHCLHKDPQRRYASAEALADDLRRFREGKPISVRPVGTAERVIRWCRRNPGWAAMIALVASSLFGVTGVSVYAYSEVSAQNVTVEKKRKEAEDAHEREKEKTLLAKSRLEQSLQAVGLFATDARMYCEDALVPGQSRAKLYEVLIRQLEKQVEQSSEEATIDALRNKAFLYQTLCAVTRDFGDHGKSEEWFDKGMATLKDWDKLRHDDQPMLSFRATFLYLRGTSLNARRKLDDARTFFLASLQIRRRLAGDPDAETASKTEQIAALADSLDSVEQFDESITLRKKVLAIFDKDEAALAKEKLQAEFEKHAKPDAHKQAIRKHQDARERSFPYRDALCESYYKAALHATDYAKRKEHLTAADKLGAELQRVRPTNRNALLRSAAIARTFGELEFNHGILAGNMNPAAAQDHFAQAEVHYAKLNKLSQKLATASDLVEGQREYARSYYTLGLVELRNNQPAKARDNFLMSRKIREATLRDYASHQLSGHLQIDLFFSQIALGDLSGLERANDFVMVYQGEPTAQYRFACVFALAMEKMKEREKDNPLKVEEKRWIMRYRETAFRCLLDAHDGGFNDLFQSNIDSDLSILRDDPRMKEFEASHHYRLGVAAKKRGDIVAAKEHWQRSQTLAQEWMKAHKDNARRHLVKIEWLCAEVQLGRVAEAIKGADELGPLLPVKKSVPMFRLARVYALAFGATKDAEVKDHCLKQAIGTLQAADRVATEELLGAEDDLNPIRDEARFQKLLELAKTRSR